MSLASGLSILFIFSKNQLLVLFIFAIVSFVYFSFISGLIFISFLLLSLGFLTCSFSSCFRLLSLEISLYCYEPSLSTAFTLSHRFWVVVFSFSFISMHILISFLISSVICWLFRSVFCSLHMFVFLIAFFLF